jgi:colanic acid/amylovoran biosynthesis glycosyltransferase
MTENVLHRHSVWLSQTENWIYNQVHYCNGGFEQHVACLSRENPDRFQVPHLHPFPQGSLLGRLRQTGLPGLRGRVTEMLWLRQRLREIRPVVVHSHFGDTGYDAARLLSRAGIKHVVTFYGYDVNRLPLVFPEWKERYLVLFQHADQFLCEGPHMAKSLVGLGCPADKVKVQHLGVEVDKIQFIPRNWNASTPLRVLIAASFREKKGIPYALLALQKVRSELPIEITIIGDASAHPTAQSEKAKILKTLDETGLRDCTRLLGYQSHAVLWQEALAHHVFLQASVTAADGDTEGGAPVGLIEMAASGMPVVATRHCDIPNVVRDGQTGLLADERNADQLAEHVLWLARHRDAWPALTENGRKHIEREFNCVIQGQKLAQIYRQLLDARTN